MSKKTEQKEKRVLEQTLDQLYLSRREYPHIILVILAVLYIAALIIVIRVSSSAYSVMMLGQPVPVKTFTGVFSALSNICVVLMAVYFGKAGFITALILLLGQFPSIIAGIARHNPSSIPGIFSTLLAVIAVVAIYLNNRRVSRYEKKLRDQAVTDTLTGLPNRFAISELLTELIRRKTPFAAVAVNINNFKSINNTIGFDNGDTFLMMISSEWKTFADAGLTDTLDFIARLNSDEFVLIIRDYKSEEDILKTIRKYDEILDDPINVDDSVFYASARYGLALYPEDATDIDTLFSYANSAMHAVKQRGSSEHVLRYSSDIAREDHLLEVGSRIRAALDSNEVFFHLQPQYDMDHKLRGFEALARLKDTDGSYLSPAEFIPAAESIGVIDMLDAAVYTKSATFVGDLIRRTGASIFLSINVSVRHLMKSDFIDEIRGLLESSGLPADRLEIEITESVMIDSLERALSCIKKIKKMGIRIAIDDFGTGYSSLSYLCSFPADLLKIDKTFIDKINISDNSKQYVAAIISLGHIMGFDVISEGVEKQDQLDILRDIGCDYIQGFIWGRPLPQEEAEKVVMDSLGT